jgi:hypothetical protein
MPTTKHVLAVYDGVEYALGTVDGRYFYCEVERQKVANDPLAMGTPFFGLGIQQQQVMVGGMLCREVTEQQALNITRHWKRELGGEECCVNDGEEYEY